MSRIFTVFALSTMLLVTACHPTIRAGAPTALASQSLTALQTADDVIVEARKQFLDGTLPASGRPAFNALVLAYSAGSKALSDYDLAVKAKSDPTAIDRLAAELSNDLGKLAASVVTIKSQLQKGK